MKKLFGILMAVILLAMPAVLAEEGTEDTTCDTGIGIGIGITPANSCPEIESVEYEVITNVDSQICDEECDGDSDCIGVCSKIVQNQRSYAFEGEEVTFDVEVVDKDGIEQDCVKVFVTLDNGYDPIEAGCVLKNVRNWKDDDGTDHNDAWGEFECTYTVEPAASGTQGEYWVSVMAEDQCGEDGCADHAPGTISLYLNPAVSLTINSQDTFGFMYDKGGDHLTEGPYAGETVYSPYFTLENSADAVSGLYLLLQIYGKDMWDYDSSDALCPDSNVLDIGNVEYKADHLNVHTTNPEWVTMPENYAGRQYVFDEGLGNFFGNFVGVGDDITMRLRLNIPSPCRGNFDDGGEIVFVGRVI